MRSLGRKDRSGIKEDRTFDIAFRCVEYGTAVDCERFRNYNTVTAAIEETYNAIKHNGRSKSFMDWIADSEEALRTMSDREYRDRFGFTRDHAQRLLRDLGTNMAIVGCR